MTLNALGGSGGRGLANINLLGGLNELAPYWLVAATLNWYQNSGSRYTWTDCKVVYVVKINVQIITRSNRSLGECIR